jgi:serine/threonine-protein kinase RsbT
VAEAKEVQLDYESDIVNARNAAREFARDLGFGMVDQTRIATAVSELARNVIRYAQSGSVVIKAVELRERTGIEITVIDQGPGIEDLELAMQEGYSTSGSLGKGLPGTRRLMDEFTINSIQGVGTTIIIRKWKR